MLKLDLPPDAGVLPDAAKGSQPRALALGECANSPPPVGVPGLAVLRPAEPAPDLPARYRFQPRTQGPANGDQPKQAHPRTFRSMLDDDSGPASGDRGSEHSGSWFHAIQEAEESGSSGPDSAPGSRGRGNDRHHRSFGSIFRAASGASLGHHSGHGPRGHRRRGSNSRKTLPPGLMGSQLSLGAGGSRASGAYDALHLNASQDTVVTVATASSPTHSRGGSALSGGNERFGFHQPTFMPLAELSSLDLASEHLDDDAAVHAAGAPAAAASAGDSDAKRVPARV